ncbi:MAG TPA: FHIPEP family type III secretion protein, partial [Polyangiaceae bacterium]|nr:FHIPEP family type III secretion protein [Polyangiaceae bacterium]
MSALGRPLHYLATDHGRQRLFALALLLACGLLILPIPGPLLDVLWLVVLSVSVVGALSILNTAHVASSAQSAAASESRRTLGAFPGMLLVVTLMRLTLTLASARAILQSGSAGILIDHVGSWLLGGNAASAWAIFIVLTVAQLVVMVRGNERIAEVRARFALDALPGRQLAIDADLRGGAIQAADAQRQRAALSSEGDLFGTLDGAMKFARGEQVALIVVVLVCVFGGVANAVFQRHTPVFSAFTQFSLLSLSMGLFAQLSAFAFAAVTGLVLTRADLARPAADVSPAKVALEQILAHAAGPLRHHAAEMLGIAETQALLDDLDPATVGQVIPSKISLATLCDILRRLLDEGVGIQDPKSILDAIALSPSLEKDPAILCEIVRTAFKRALTQAHTDPSGQLRVILVAPEVEEILRGSLTRGAASSVLQLSPAARRDVIAATQRALAQAQSADTTNGLVVLASPDVRRFVREILATDLPALAVLSPTELLPTTSLRPLATISVQGL